MNDNTPPNWKPTDLDAFVGQRTLMTQIEDEVVAAVATNEPLPHCLFDGQPGLGKSTMVEMLASVCNRPVKTVMGSSLDSNKLTELLTRKKHDPTAWMLGDGYERGVLVNSALARPWILFIDECEKMKREVTENLHYVMQPDGRGVRWFMAKTRKGPTKAWVPAGTIIFATNFRGEFNKVGEAVINRCPIKYTFQRYTPEEMVSVIGNYSIGVGQAMTDGAIGLIATRSLGVPRNGLALFNRSRVKLIATRLHHQEMPDMIDEDVVNDTCRTMGIDAVGLSREHTKYMQCLALCPNMTAGLDSLCAMTLIDKDTVKLLERDLIEKRFVNVSGSGRNLTDIGLEHLNPDEMDPVMDRALD
jgi:Holliday junction DNA helicase RuvB